jgi:hypothetical protein
MKVKNEGSKRMVMNVIAGESHPPLGTSDPTRRLTV